MQILLCQEPGRLEYGERPDPRREPHTTILRIQKIGICGTDLHAFEGTQPYFNYPRILGHELAATIEENDPESEFSKGDLVTLVPYFNCGTCAACRSGKPNCCVALQVAGVHIDGGMATFLAVPTASLVRGENLPADTLALIEPLAIGAHAVRRAAIQPGENVLVVGAGPIGMGVIEFARLSGANVIALDSNPQRLAFCEEKLHVDYVINPSKQEVRAALTELTNGAMLDVVMDATGNLAAIENSFQYIGHGGRYMLVGLQKEFVRFSHPEFHKREATLMTSRNATRQDFETVINAIKTKTIDPTVLISHRVGFGQVSEKFPEWLKPSTGVIKVIVEMTKFK